MIAGTSGYIRITPGTTSSDIVTRSTFCVGSIRALMSTKRSRSSGVRQMSEGVKVSALMLEPAGSRGQGGEGASGRDPVTARPLGLVHGGVGGAVQLLPVEALAWLRGAGAPADRHRQAAHGRPLDGEA